MSTEVKMQAAKARGMSEADAVVASIKTPKADGLTDMKITKAEMKERNKPSTACCGSDSKYPYGLEIRLDDDAMTKLGIALPDVGSEVTITAKAAVNSAESRDSVGGGKRLSCSLQITKLKVG